LYTHAINLAGMSSTISSAWVYNTQIPQIKPLDTQRYRAMLLPRIYVARLTGSGYTTTTNTPT
jgi:hypothetical protein